MISPIALIFVALLSTSSARPSPQLYGLPGAFYHCDAINFQAGCSWMMPENAKRCHQQGGEGVGMMSIGPDPGTTCKLYATVDCSGAEIREISWPGIANGVPRELGSIRCFKSQQSRALPAEDSTPKALNLAADPRLAGGVGSMERLKHIKELREMEKDGFKEGLIGFKKGFYY
ncbi:hypothetical protein FB567DRAFT_631828 [Paraphoma chrysanthemicola]|uniref:Uncharacterized protein n=1 Tax=Paraphoma chrysanthemicola TaxID=798071 RepID=A0A8K0QZI4_9PLEO|nr:hypothetical protein FB567DRAFT_631828 [Paraphoma chrysanthemicola]